MTYTPNIITPTQLPLHPPSHGPPCLSEKTQSALSWQILILVESNDPDYPRVGTGKRQAPSSPPTWVMLSTSCISRKRLKWPIWLIHLYQTTWEAITAVPNEFSGTKSSSKGGFMGPLSTSHGTIAYIL